MSDTDSRSVSSVSFSNDDEAERNASRSRLADATADVARQARSFEHLPAEPHNTAGVEEVLQRASSMPNIKLAPYVRRRPRVGYADLYADSYSDSDVSNNGEAQEEAGERCLDMDELGGSSASLPHVAIIHQRLNAPPRAQAPKVGAARLSEMMYGKKRQRAADPETNEDPPQASNNRYRRRDRRRVNCPPLPLTTGPDRNIGGEDVDASGRGGGQEEQAKQEGKKRSRRLHVTHASQNGFELPDLLAHLSRDFADGSDMPSSNLLFPTEFDTADSPLADAQRARRSGSTDTRITAQSHKVSQQFNLRLSVASEIVGNEEFNGLLAPGAFADEKERAKADGSKLRKILFLRKGRERELKMFKPVVFDPSRKNMGVLEASGIFDMDDDLGGDDRALSKFPFCCCAARYCVAISFVAIILLFLMGFFVWPRVPTLSISSLMALQPAQVIYDVDHSMFGLRMPLRINYEIHSGNFYPLVISRVHVAGFDGVTGNKIIDAVVTKLPVAPQQLQFYSSTAWLSYLTSDMADPALVDLFGKCAPKSAGLPRSEAERSGKLTIRFQISVDVMNLGWLRQPIVTLNQQVECPE
ncbi:hypothetical protein GQ54DRAFT_309925 [Martensiomyces pterosporus]|nr:hypothetical protein GQ54DRAFT_309925 [Martensiomyces pterosporus]